MNTSDYAQIMDSSGMIERRGLGVGERNRGGGSVRSVQERLRLIDERFAAMLRRERKARERARRFDLIWYVVTFDFATLDEKRRLARVLRKAWEWGIPPESAGDDVVRAHGVVKSTEDRGKD